MEIHQDCANEAGGSSSLIIAHVQECSPLPLANMSDRDDSCQVRGQDGEAGEALLTVGVVRKCRGMRICSVGFKSLTLAQIGKY